MNQLPSQIVFPHHPREYRTQWYIHCGTYCVQNLLSALDRNVHDDPRDYNFDRWSRLRGRNQPEELATILRQNNVRAEVKTAIELSDEERMKLLKRELASGHPVILLINNGYTRSGKYSPLQSWLLQKIACHWILLYGYDDASERFYIYDPYTDGRKVKEKPPIGNISRPYADVLRDWGEVKLYSPSRFTYIPCEDVIQ